ncbi:periplasmic binding protein-like I [Gaertneriomyces semiglobifer]|nr:periplasmic binding protein-like I [Gaertneriomyces semiglobifer]
MKTKFIVSLIAVTATPVWALLELKLGIIAVWKTKFCTRGRILDRFSLIEVPWFSSNQPAASPNIPLQDAYDGIRYAVQLAAHDFTADGSRLPGVDIVIETFLVWTADSFNDFGRSVDTAAGAGAQNVQGIGAGQALLDTVDLIRTKKVVGLIGDTYSDPCKTAAVVAGQLRIPQCSPSCYDPSLANKELYPYFFRTMASGLVQANAVGDVIEAMGWQRVVMLYSPDSMGSSVAAAFRDRSLVKKQTGFIITKEVYFNQEGLANHDWERTAEHIGTLPNRVFFISAQMQEISALFKALNEKGLLTEDRIWITTPMLGLGLYIADLGLPKIKEIGRNIWSINAQEYYTTVSGSLTEGAISFRQDLLNKFEVGGAHDPPRQRTLINPSPYAAFAYDCTLQMLLGFQRVVEAGGTVETTIDDEVETVDVNPESLAEQYLGSLLRPPAFANVTATGSLHFATTDGDIMLMDAVGDRIGRYEFAQIADSGVAWKTFGYAGLPGSNENVTMLQTTPVRFVNDIPYIADIVPNKDTTFTGNSPAAIAITAIAAFMIVVALSILGLIVIHRENKVIKATSPLFNLVTLSGIVLAYAALICMVQKPSMFTCNFGLVGLWTGFALVFGPLSAKTWRVYRIFDNARALGGSLTNRNLLAFTTIVVSLELLFLIIWIAISPYSPTLTMSTDYQTSMWQCKSTDRIQSTMQIVLIAYNGVILAFTAYVSYKSRGASSRFNESTYIAFCIYNVIVACGIGVIVIFMGDLSYGARWHLQNVVVLVAITVCLLALFVPKCLALYLTIGQGASGELMVLSKHATATSGPTTQATRPMSKVPKKTGVEEGQMRVVEESVVLHATNLIMTTLRQGATAEECLFQVEGHGATVQIQPANVSDLEEWHKLLKAYTGSSNATGSSNDKRSGTAPSTGRTEARRPSSHPSVGVNSPASFEV